MTAVARRRTAGLVTAFSCVQSMVARPPLDLEHPGQVRAIIRLCATASTVADAFMHQMLYAPAAPHDETTTATVQLPPEVIDSVCALISGLTRLSSHPRLADGLGQRVAAVLFTACRHHLVDLVSRALSLVAAAMMKGGDDRVSAGAALARAIDTADLCDMCRVLAEALRRDDMPAPTAVCSLVYIACRSDTFAAALIAPIAATGLVGDACTRLSKSGSTHLATSNTAIVFLTSAYNRLADLNAATALLKSTLTGAGTTRTTDKIGSRPHLADHLQRCLPFARLLLEGVAALELGGCTATVEALRNWAECERRARKAGDLVEAGSIRLEPHHLRTLLCFTERVRERFDDAYWLFTWTWPSLSPRDRFATFLSLAVFMQRSLAKEPCASDTDGSLSSNDHKRSVLLHGRRTDGVLSMLALVLEGEGGGDRDRSAYAVWVTRHSLVRDAEALVRTAPAPTLFMAPFVALQAVHVAWRVAVLTLTGVGPSPEPRRISALMALTRLTATTRKLLRLYPDTSPALTTTRMCELLGMLLLRDVPVSAWDTRGVLPGAPDVLPSDVPKVLWLCGVQLLTAAVEHAAWHMRSRHQPAAAVETHLSLLMLLMALVCAGRSDMVAASGAPRLVCRVLMVAYRRTDEDLLRDTHGDFHRHTHQKHYSALDERVILAAAELLSVALSRDTLSWWSALQDFRARPFCGLSGLSSVLQAAGLDDRVRSGVWVTWDTRLVSASASVARMCGCCCNLRCRNVQGSSEAALRCRICAGCRRARYCSDACQRSSWRHGHRQACTTSGVRSGAPSPP